MHRIGYHGNRVTSMMTHMSGAPSSLNILVPFYHSPFFLARATTITPHSIFNQQQQHYFSTSITATATQVKKQESTTATTIEQQEEENVDEQPTVNHHHHEKKQRKNAPPTPRLVKKVYNKDHVNAPAPPFVLFFKKYLDHLKVMLETEERDGVLLAHGIPPRYKQQQKQKQKQSSSSDNSGAIDGLVEGGEAEGDEAEAEEAQILEKSFDLSETSPFRNKIQIKLSLLATRVWYDDKCMEQEKKQVMEQYRTMRLQFVEQRAAQERKIKYERAVRRLLGGQTNTEMTEQIAARLIERDVPYPKRVSFYFTFRTLKDREVYEQNPGIDSKAASKILSKLYSEMTAEEYEKVQALYAQPFSDYWKTKENFAKQVGAIYQELMKEHLEGQQ